ncbi:uncharacterized protein Z518_08878 [Rhinocladiella mackenziei CBS 650.93]|uniref:Rhinocladiella mackenziei CBS 650.93 unplaced genomic scaffold supercont1.7, whole genome shotgun sequence n=1 Tax=Rhinocladiella mackenziei CBS 650.93 TaxID=1442369 RepID=A0A0D2GS57_9EURO|nr:uncharacterized protein Z518_08878 [Rhinocladiella mackenziei CBS 650.93]KIX01153.1 hypothetical protein Z518_08878 [Rhinocladiella mackenziei CBS 650.93]
MAYIPNFDENDVVITLGIFGVQHDGVTDFKKSVINSLWGLLHKSADRVEYLQNEQQGQVDRMGRNCTTTFLAYWGDCREYQIWNESKEFQNLWNSLPDDAGVWREVLTVPKSRFTGSMSVDTPWGLNAVVGTKPTLDIGYWGVFRKRMSEVTDKHTVLGDTFTSKYVTQHAKSRAGEGKKIVDLEIPPSSAIRLGRLKVSRVPDNLFFLHEGQRKLKRADGVIGSWMDRVQPLFESFKQHLIKERNKNGVVAYEAYIARKNSSSALDKSRLTNQVIGIDPTVNIEELEADRIIETNQLIYWLDMAHFELSGRAFHNHVKLRKETTGLIAPGGEGYNDKNASLYVEMCVLKSSDVEAEYIGCKEGTGLMMFADMQF